MAWLTADAVCSDEQSQVRSTFMAKLRDELYADNLSMLSKFLNLGSAGRV